LSKCIQILTANAS